jgi:putative acetyltransferase
VAWGPGPGGAQGSILTTVSPLPPRVRRARSPAAPRASAVQSASNDVPESADGSTAAPGGGPGWRLRPIEPADDPEMAAVIREVMPEFGAEGPGFALSDPEVDFMHRAYAGERHAYNVVERAAALAAGQRRFLGGAGVAPLVGGDGRTAELRKMYVRREGRGLGIGCALLGRAVEQAREFGFERLYLETLTGMDAAQRLYLKFGFERIDAPLGDTGHGGCDRWFLLDLSGARP